MASKLDNQPNGYNPNSVYVLGIDFSRMGADETGIIILEQLPDHDKIFISYLETIAKKPLNETIGRVLYLHSIFNFRKIICDVTGLGAGPVDVLKEKLGGIVEGITFTAATKADMFYNLKLLLQQKKLIIPDYRASNKPAIKKLFYQFLSIRQEFGSNSSMPKFTHEDNTHDDLICALALACLFFRVGKKFRKGYGLGSGRGNF